MTVSVYVIRLEPRDKREEIDSIKLQDKYPDQSFTCRYCQCVEVLVCLCCPDYHHPDTTRDHRVL